MTRKELVYEMLHAYGYSDEDIHEQQNYAESMMPGMLRHEIPDDELARERSQLMLAGFLHAACPEEFEALKNKFTKEITGNN